MVWKSFIKAENHFKSVENANGLFQHHDFNHFVANLA